MVSIQVSNFKTAFILTWTDDLYDASDDEVTNLAADIGRFELDAVEVFNVLIPEEALMGDDPVFILSRLESQEYRAHDHIQERLQAEEQSESIFSN